MTVLGRREFLAGAGALAATVRLTAFAEASAVKKADATFLLDKPKGLSLQTPVKPEGLSPHIFPASVRADFPSVLRETYLNSAAMHPVGTFAAATRPVRTGQF